MTGRECPATSSAHLRFRHPIRFYRARHDDADAAVARRVRRHGLGPHPDVPEGARIKATWFTPGFTIESWPRESAAVVEGGHEIGHHSWAHIPNANQSRDEEEADLVRANENIRKLTGRPARGYRSPSWDLSPHTVDLLLKHGFLYDSSLMGADYIPYRARRGDTVELGKPYGFGEETALIEMPISWSLDDIRTSSSSARRRR